MEDDGDPLKGIILTFGNRWAYAKLYLLSLLQMSFQIEKKELYNSKITKFEKESDFTDTTTRNTLDMQAILRYAFTSREVFNASYIEQWGRRTFISTCRSTLVYHKQLLPICSQLRIVYRGLFDG